jgi:hypothetical protein
MRPELARSAPLLRHPLAACLLLAASPAAMAATYNVGPGQQYTQLSTLFNSVALAPGDVVLVRGGTTYNGGIVMGSNDGGTAANPVTVRWDGQGGSRPRLQGGTHTIKFQQSNHVVFEGFEITGGSSTCLFNEAHNVVVRNVLIRDCPGHGILGADLNSGSFTLEYSEVRNAGSGTMRHPIYMQSDQVTWPDAVFRMRFNYIHSGNGGNLVKSRHQRAEIHYNWFEGATYQALELVGPDCQTQRSGWTPNLKREDADVVGNVIIQTSSWRNAIRVGGDLNGRSQGRVRLVNNTILFDRSGTSNAVLVQLGLESLEMHNNVIHQTGSGTLNIVAENPASSVDTPVCAPTSREPWTSGRKVAGSNNWVPTSAASVPGEWSGTLRGSDPQLTGIAQRALRPRDGSPLVSAGNPSPQAPSGFPFPSPLALPLFDPPLRAILAVGAQQARNYGTRIDIGALESASVAPPPPPPPQPPRRRNGAQPLLPTGAAAQSMPATAAASRQPVASTDAGAPPADASPATGAVRPATVRIDAPIVVVWRRLRDWIGTVAGNQRD